MAKVAKNAKKKKSTKPETSAASKAQSESTPKLSTEETKVTGEKIESVAVSDTTQEEKIKPQTPNIQAGTESAPGISIELEAEKSSLISRKLVILIIVVLVLGGLVVGGILIFRSSGSTPSADKKPAREAVSQPKEEKRESLEASPGASITEEPEKEGTEINLADYSVQLLNGSGVAGEAGRIKDILETEGFEEFDVDNADSYDYTDTEVSLKKEVPKEVFEKIKSAMEDYTVVKENTLTEDAKYDVLVIIGQKKE